MGGVRYVNFGNAPTTGTTQVSGAPANGRVVSAFGGQLYLSSASGANIGINKVGSGLPTGTGNATTLLGGVTPANSYSYVFLDREPAVAGVDTLYVADNSAGLLKYSFDGTAWTARGSVARSGLTGIIATTGATGVDIYVASPSSLATLTDTAAFNAPLSGSFSQLATAATKTAFRGVAGAPQDANAATSPTGTGNAQPNTLQTGESTLLSVTVTSGTNPASTGLAVMANLSAIGGSSTQSFFDDGSNGDTVASDLVFSYLATPTSGTGLLSLPVSISDVEGRTNSTAIALTVTSPAGISFIHDIQGSSDTPQTDLFRVEGIVTAVFPNLGGFYVQEEDADWDANSLTSEGIFVNANDAVQVGQQVQVQGTVTNEFGLTQFGSGATVTVGNGGALQALPAAVTPVLPSASPVAGTNYFERFEGMRVRFPGALYVTDHFNLGSFGEVSLSPVDHLFIPTNSIDVNDAPAAGTTAAGTSNLAEINARKDLNLRNRIILDDLRDGSDPAPTPYLYASPLGGRTLRLGDSVGNLEGILSYGFGAYRIRPTAPVNFTNTNPRTATPPAVGGNVRVASLNVLNYFTTFGGANDRGANSTAELNRQRAKLVSALIGLNGDVVGLIEMQNNGFGPGSALNDLLNHPNGLNATLAALGQQPYSIVPPPASPFGTDAIQVAFIYKAATVTPSGSAVTDTVNAAVHNRPPLAQLFTANATGGSFFACINHFKSKSPGGATGANADQNDGQSAYNQSRKDQANALINFLDGLKVQDPDILVLGDLNAYGEEDPIDLFRAAGYIDAIGTRSFGEEPYSFLFFNEVGRLDHGLVTPSANQQITGATEWHINADEPEVIDYNLDVGGFGTPPPKPDDAYVANAFRCSDHDPLLIGLQLEAAPLNLSPAYGRAGTTLSISGPGLGSATAVRFAGNIDAQFTVQSNSQLSVTVPANAQTGQVQVLRPSGTLSSGVFRLLPRITALAPASGQVGAEITIQGSGFLNASRVTFANNVAANFIVGSDSAIRVSVPAGAVRGNVRVETPGGAATSLARFTVAP